VRYTAYGDIRGRFDATSGTLPATESKRQEFTNYETETETGLQYAHARFYDPTLALFLTHDPAAQFSNPYEYTAYDPANSSDPTGMFDPVTFLFWAAITLVVASAVYTGVTTGDWFMGVFTLAIGLGTVLVAPAINELLVAGLDVLLPSAAAEAAVTLAGVGQTVYGLASSIESGNVIGVLGAAVAVAGLAYAVASSSSTSEAGTPFTGRDRGEQVVPPDFEEGASIPADAKRKILLGDEAKVAGETSIRGGTRKIGGRIAESLEKITLHHASQDEVDLIAARFGVKAKDVNAWAAGTKIFVPPGRGLRLYSLSHEVAHVHQYLNIRMYGSAYATESAVWRGRGLSALDAYVRNRYEIMADRFGRSVLRAN
jgi:RHS repeat-associated protein